MIACEYITEACGCGATFSWRGDSYGRGAALEGANQWRSAHRHIEPASRNDGAAAKTADIAYRAARMDEEAAAVRRDLAKRQLRAEMDGRGR